MTDPVTGQTVCSCQYERLQALQNGLAAGYGPAAAAAAARLAAVSSAVTGVTGLHGVYSAAYPSSDQNPYPSLGMDSTTAFYSSLVSSFSPLHYFSFFLIALSCRPRLFKRSRGPSYISRRLDGDCYLPGSHRRAETITRRMMS